MNGSNLDLDPAQMLRMKDLLQRLFLLRGRFKAVLPSSVERFRSQALEDNSGGKISQLFFLLGMMITSQEEPIPMGEISRAMDVPLSTATRIVDWFVRNDYARRLPDPEDRRIVRITWTDAGHEVYQAMSMHVLERIDKLLSHLSEPEREQFVNLMEKLTNILEQDI
jgi:MarR family transcriptional regulator, organic hydroperoxide resistance regulator